MKRNKGTIYLVLALLVVWCPMFMAAWNKDKPSSSTSLRASNPEILANWDALETAMAQDHEFSTGGTNSGKHEVLTMEEEASAGASSANELHVQAIDGGSGQPELAVTSEDGDELQMTKDGDLYSSDNLQIAGTSAFTGSIAVNTDKFTVAAASGNTLVAGTLDVTGNIDPTTYETTNGGFLDEDDLTSDATDKVASQQSIKAYVDAYIKLVDSKASTTQGGTFTSGSWTKRTVAEETDVGSHVSVSSSVIVLDAGTYQCRISAPAYKVDLHQIRLRNTTGSSTILVGTSEISAAADGVQTRSIIVGRFTIAASQNLEIHHYAETTRNVNGLGAGNSFGEVEIYTIAEFWKR